MERTFAVPPLFRLPPEARNYIYELVLNPPLGIDIHVQGPYARLEAASLPTPNRIFALTRTCQIIYQETRGFKFVDNKFRFHMGCFDESVVFKQTHAAVGSVVIDEHLQRWRRVFDEWWRKLQERNEGNVREIQIVIDGWDMTRYSTAPGLILYHLVRALVGLGASLQYHGTCFSIGLENICYVKDSFALALTKSCPSSLTRLDFIELSTTDKAEAEDAIEAATREMSPMLEEAWGREKITGMEYSALQGTLNECQEQLGRFVADLFIVKRRYERGIGL